MLAVWSSWTYLVHKSVTNGFHVFCRVSGFCLHYPWPCGLGLSHEKEEHEKKHDNEKTKLRCWYSLWCLGLCLDDNLSLSLTFWTLEYCMQHEVKNFQRYWVFESSCINIVSRSCSCDSSGWLFAESIDILKYRIVGRQCCSFPPIFTYFHAHFDDTSFDPSAALIQVALHQRRIHGFRCHYDCNGSSSESNCIASQTSEFLSFWSIMPGRFTIRPTWGTISNND